MPTIHCPPLPTDTADTAELLFGCNNPYLKIGRRLDDCHAGLLVYQPAGMNETQGAPFWPFAVISILQFWEDLTDRQMAEAVYSRADWNISPRA